MRAAGIRGAPAGVLAAVAVVAHPGAGLGQGTGTPPGGRVLTFGISTELRAHTNLELDPVSAGETIRSDTRLSFGYVDETPVSVLSFDAATLLRVEEGAGSTSTDGAAFPTLRLGYAREGANARFSFDAAYRQSEVDVFDLVFDPDLGTVNFINDTGTRHNYSVGATLETGTSGPLGFAFDLGHDGTRYVDTLDAALFDSTTTRGAATVTLQFSPVTAGRVRASVRHYEADNTTGTVRDTYTLRVGATHAFSETTELDVSVGGSQIDDSDTGTRRSFEVNARLGHELPRGAVALSFDSDLTIAGRRDRIAAERRFDFPLGALTVSVGAVDAPGVDPQPVGSLLWTHEFVRGSVSASLSRGVSVNDDADVQGTTQAALGLGFELTPYASIDLSIDYAHIDGAGGGGVADTDRGSFGASYNYALTEDWTLSAGYRARYLDEAGATGAAWDNAVFVSLGRNFTLLP